ncbi:mitochondrial 37S ribosomal protein uS5m NDAI_0E03560 [Naumovozyma dairenensis CBS 421]|uniref:Small ribosomal subunit protein uS5m n=1 Tax=Naumovozyma dairenensis (strain ATCC 10597 / BCRC 20456 / CBS 421 / NBRC 0211 / NRRL Y-12639) TaxID=1071378 RepID=G0WBQ3_NAUDC|nr:hypothetical protein NDAI_0E03560 [Naumovozyma dairenensis CBS 421]CCD25173.1 hypothetical protein NDAI_0E03560 [Naumovozyma dairenensis CBS 421]
MNNIIWKRTFNTRPMGFLKHYNEDILSKYYSKPLLESIQLAQQVIPEGTTFKRQDNVQIAPVTNPDYSKIDPFWDYKPGTPHAHSFYNNTYKWDAVQQRLPPGGVPVPKGESILLKDSSKLMILARGLKFQNGIDADYISKKLVMKPLVMKRVSNQTRKGKIPSYYSLVVVGDKNGMVGLGEGKSRESMSKSIFKAHWDAVRNLKYVVRYENRTILADIDHRYHGVKLFLRNARPGFGLRVNHVIFEICECAGIKDLSGKIYKSRNPMNIAKGFLEALTENQKTVDEIALGRGKKIVDVRKVYYSA